MKRQPRAVKRTLTNYQCGNCDIGIVQVKSERTIRDVVTKVSGCLNCGNDYGIQQASRLPIYEGDDLTWA